MAVLVGRPGNEQLEGHNKGSRERGKIKREEGKEGKRRAYPCVVELGLHTDHVAFFLVLCAQDL